ncbi:hypothetical protein EON82_14240 [bacterium]|nr:MAG: hypothetical protein EON82_14240 [bacterium]
MALVLLPLGAAIPMFLLAYLAWNWDAQGGCLMCPIGGLYLFGAFIPGLKCLSNATDSGRPDAERRIYAYAVGIALILSIAMSAWASTLPGPITREENLRCYQTVWPYQPQPGCP